MSPINECKNPKVLNQNRPNTRSTKLQDHNKMSQNEEKIHRRWPGNNRGIRKNYITNNRKSAERKTRKFKKSLSN